jgi:pentatricopeptide repeat protein
LHKANAGLGFQLDDAVKAFREVEERFQVKPLASMFNILIDFSCRQGEISQGLDFLDEMQQRGLVLSHFSFNPFIREFARWTMIEEAFEMKAAMHRVSVQPSVVTYHSLIGICVKLGDVSNFHHPSACSYQCLLTLLFSLTRDLVAQVGYCTPSCTTPHWHVFNNYSYRWRGHIIFSWK